MKAIVLLTVFFCLSSGSPLQNTTLHCNGDCRKGDDAALMNRVMRLKLKEHEECVREHMCPTVTKALGPVPCKNGKSGEYSCSNVDLLSFVPLITLGTLGDGNDIWGWTDPETGKEYAIVCLVDGTSFVDLSVPEKPNVVGFMKTQTVTSLWRDVKVYKDHAYVVSEARDHGMQVFDLTRLRSINSFVNDLKPDTVYTDGPQGSRLGSTHNIVANEDSGFLYAVGTKTCTSGLHMIDVRDPKKPVFAGCFGEDGYVHDAQCVIYKGPDLEYAGKEICFCYNENTLTIVDVSDKSKPEMISRTGYVGAQYTHQGWLIEDQSCLLLNDELDELIDSINTRSMIWNVTYLDKPELIDSFYSKEKAIDHNLYIKGNLAYEANYCAGLRILDISTIKPDEDLDLKEVGFFDVAPDCDTAEFLGAWSSYVYFKSEIIIVSSIERGLFVLKYNPQDGK